MLTTVSIGDCRSLTVVRFGERVLLLGSTQQSVTLLAVEGQKRLLPVADLDLRYSDEHMVADVGVGEEPSFEDEFERQQELACAPGADCAEGDLLSDGWR